jgi:hypothetical protein
MVKKIVIRWTKGKKQKYEKTLRDVEEALVVHYNSVGFGYLTEEQKTKVERLEDKKRKLLLEKEKECRLKNRALWLHA